jgi:peptidoglycan hydrolase-like protein with peptidoglycan-binding domain
MPPDGNGRDQELRRYLRGNGVALELLLAVSDPWKREEWTQRDVEALGLIEGAGGGTLDDRSYARWVQSVLRATVDPELPVDGRIGTRTRLAVQRFQANAQALGVKTLKLEVDGALTAQTLSALQAVGGVPAPGGSPVEPDGSGARVFVKGGFLLAPIKVAREEGEVEGLSVLALGGRDARILVDGKAQPIVGKVPLVLRPRAPESAPVVTRPVVTGPRLPITPVGTRPVSVRPVSTAPLTVRALSVGTLLRTVELRPGAPKVRFVALRTGQPVALTGPPVAPKKLQVQKVLVTLPLTAAKKKAGGGGSAPKKTKWQATEVLVKHRDADLVIDALRLRHILDLTIRDRVVGGKGSGQAPAQGEQPSDEASVDEVPVDEVPVDETPVDETPVDETPEGPLREPMALEDVSSFARWVQSALKATVAPDIEVDGVVGPITRAAVTAFQQALPDLVEGAEALAGSGALDQDTIAGLELATGTTRPDRPDYAVPDTPPPAAGDLEPAVATTEIDAQGRVWNVVRQGGDEVRFRYNIKQHAMPGEETIEDPYNVWSYEGGRTGLLSEPDLMSAGFSASGVKILQENAFKESGGKFGAVNTWDNQYVSWGMAQFAGHAGTLATLLARLKEHPDSAPAFRRFFVANGIDVEHGSYPWWDRSDKAFITKTGWHVVVRADSVHTGDVGWVYIRTQPRLVGTFMLAGNDPTLQLGQVRFWREKFFDNCISKTVLDEGHEFRRYITSELGVGLAARLFNWMPAYLRKWFGEIVDALARENPGQDLQSPATWQAAPGLEADYIVKMRDKRRAAKQGDWEDYGDTLSEERGSFS